jgi:hypothetical protein
MMHPEIMRFAVDDHVAALKADARRAPAAMPAPRRASELADVELRLCRCADDLELAHLAELDGRPLPFGRFVVAVVRGRIVAALPLGGGRPLTDPFTATEHLLPLLELRAAQLREPATRRRFLPWALAPLRGSSHA